MRFAIYVVVAHCTHTQLEIVRSLDNAAHTKGCNLCSTFFGPTGDLLQQFKMVIIAGAQKRCDFYPHKGVSLVYTLFDFRHLHVTMFGMAMAMRTV